MSNATQAKNIILCSDGTGNRGGKGHGTNVWRLFNYLDLDSQRHTPNAPRQIGYYDDGVGTEDWKLFKIMGGAFGWGLSRNIRDLYQFLASNYEPGDRIFLFGFSRGAFTVRSLAGMITRCGIVRREGTASAAEFARLVHDAFQAYRDCHRRGDDSAARHFKREHSHGDEKIACIGVWDTVDAIGVPFDELRVALDKIFKNSFHSHDLSPDIEYGYHALSIDDQRKTFHPVMWDEKLSAERGRKAGSIEQTWFAGVHANVGGGYPKQGLANVTLEWMMRRAERHGLIFEQGALQTVTHAANVGDKLYDSRAGLAAYYRYLPRDIEAITNKYCLGKARIHHSVFERIDQSPLGYGPGNLPEEFDIVSDGHPTPEGDAAGWDGLYARLREHRRRHQELLDQARAYIAPRRRLYTVFILLSLLALATTAYLKIGDPRYAELGWFSLAAWYRPLPMYLLEHPLLGAGVALVLAGIFLLRQHFIDQTRERLREYWWRLRPLFRREP